MKGITKTYHSYGNIYSSTAEIFYPKSIEELQQIVTFCHKEGRKITPAGSFHSFDRQNAGKDVVISMCYFDAINCDVEQEKLVVGAGASWGNIFDVVYENKCLLYTCITGSAPTAGGTLSINTYSVWSPGVGREGTYCLSFKLVTTEGVLLNCSRTENSSLFYGVIGGMGLLGFIVEITYRVLHVGSHVQIEFTLQDHEHIEDIEKRLDLRKNAEVINQLESIQSQSTLFFLHQDKPQFLSIGRYYKKINDQKKGSKLFFWGAVLASGFIRFFPKVANSVVYKDNQKPVHKRSIFKNLNYLRYGTFWAQPDYVWSKKFSRFFQRLGYEPKMYQNCYFIPTGEEKVTEFVKKTYELSQELGLQTFMFDVLYCPKEDPYVLTPTRQSDGFFVNTTFMESNDKDALMQCYQELNQLAFDMGGSLNLGKNCFIEPPLLEKMYAPALEEFIQLKQQYDPSNLLTSDFFEHYFPSYFGKEVLTDV